MSKLFSISRPSLTMIGAPLWIGKPKHGGNAFREILSHSYINEIFQKKTFDSMECFSRSQLFQLSKTISSEFTITIGGDHSITVSTVGGQLCRRKNVGLIWIDQHIPAIFNQVKSGYEHGSSIFQLTHQHQCVFKFPSLDQKNIVYVGSNHKSDNETHQYILNDIIEHGVDGVAKKIYSNLKKCDSIHVVFDIDAIDLKYIKCTQLPNEYGMTLQESKHFIKMIRKYFGTKFISMDVVEIDTTFGSCEELERTIEAARQIISSSL